MATGGVFKLIANDGKSDRMLMATRILTPGEPLVVQTAAKLGVTVEEFMETLHRAAEANYDGSTDDDASDADEENDDADEASDADKA